MLYLRYAKRMEMARMNKWKHTARTIVEISKSFIKNQKTILQKGSLVIIEKEVSEGQYLVTDSKNSSDPPNFSFINTLI